MRQPGLKGVTTFEEHVKSEFSTGLSISQFDLLAAGASLFTVGVGGPSYDLTSVRDWVAWRDSQS